MCKTASITTMSIAARPVIGSEADQDASGSHNSHDVQPRREWQLRHQRSRDVSAQRE